MKKMDRKKFLNNLGLLTTTALVTPTILAASTPVAATTGPIVPLNRKIKVGVIGCGSVSTKYLPHLSKSPFVEIVSVCDIAAVSTACLAVSITQFIVEFDGWFSCRIGRNFHRRIGTCCTRDYHVVTGTDVQGDYTRIIQ